MNKIRPDFNESDLGENIFLMNLTIPVSKVVVDGKYIIDNDGIVLPMEIDIEKDESCRVYVDKSRRMAMTALSGRAKELLIWMFYSVDNSKDYLWINRDRYMRECGIKSHNTYKGAEKELIKGGFIAYTAIKGVFWINPHFFFNGSRVRKYIKKLTKK